MNEEHLNSVSDVSGEADYFSAILAQQNDTQFNQPLPDALSDFCKLVNSAFQDQAINQPKAKAHLVDSVQLKGFAETALVVAFQRNVKGAEQIIAFDQNAIVGLAALLLGADIPGSNRKPSQMELRITEAFVALTGAEFVSIQSPNTRLNWHEFMAAKLPLGTLEKGPFLMLLINRRQEKSAPIRNSLPVSPHLTTALQTGVLNVDYILDGGLVSLADLHTLAAGLVLPLSKLSDSLVEARTDGQSLFKAGLNIKSNSLQLNVTQAFAGGRND